MIRKSILALTAVADPRRRRARSDLRFGVGFKGGGWGHHGWGHGFGFYGFYGASYVDADAELLPGEELNRFGECV